MTSNRNFFMLAAAGVLGASLLTLAVAQTPARGEGRPEFPISVADMQSRMHGRSAAIDANKDGFITAAEKQAHREAQRAERQERRMARLDTNKDGRISVAEFEDARMQRIARADANKDGQITREEMKAMRGQHGGKRHGRHHRRGGMDHATAGSDVPSA